MARADRGVATREPTQGERLGHPLGEPGVASLEVEHEHGPAVRRLRGAQRGRAAGGTGSRASSDPTGAGLARASSGGAPRDALGRGGRLPRSPAPRAPRLSARRAWSCRTDARRRRGVEAGGLILRPGRSSSWTIVRTPQRLRHCEPHEHDRRTRDDVEHEVVGGRDDRERHRQRHREANARTARCVVVWKRTIPTSRFQPACKLGKAAYLFVSVGGWRARYLSEYSVTVSTIAGISKARGRHRDTPRRSRIRSGPR